MPVINAFSPSKNVLQVTSAGFLLKGEVNLIDEPISDEVAAAAVYKNIQHNSPKSDGRHYKSILCIE